MKLLALDTSSVTCTVALAYDDGLWERHEEQPREHTRLLVPMIESILKEAGVDLPDLDAIVLGNGPGSFIGMRIAASVAQGLAHGAGLGIVPVSSLAAVATEVFAGQDAQYAAVAQDAHMSEVYFGLYRRGQDELPVEVSPERIQGQSPIDELTALSAESIAAAGDGWNRYPALFDGNSDALAANSSVLFPRARYLLPLGDAGLQAEGSLAAVDLNPAYLREKVAQVPAPKP